MTENELRKAVVAQATAWLGYQNTTASAGNGIAGLGYQEGAVIKTENMGSGNAHNNMPPYLAIYVWKRTA